MELFDLHCDTLTECLARSIPASDPTLGIYPVPGEDFPRRVQVFAAFIPDELRGEAAYRHFLAQRETLLSQQKWISLCTSMEDAEKAFSERKIAGFLSVEGGAALDGRIERVGRIASLGVKLLTFTWNGECELGYGALSPDLPLKPFGLEVLSACEREGIIADVSHLSRAGFWSVAERATKPFVATHSNADAICPHPRNLTDDQLRAILNADGLIGLNFHRPFVGEGEGTERLLAHIRHICRLGGEKQLCLGGDFDGSDQTVYPNAAGLAALYEAICIHENKELADGIFFDNANRFFSSQLS